MGIGFPKKPQASRDDNHNRHHQSEPEEITPKIHKAVNFSRCKNALLIADMRFKLSCSAMEEIQIRGPREICAVSEITDEIRSRVKSGEFSICLRLDNKTGLITLHSVLENIRMYGRRGERHAEMMA